MQANNGEWVTDLVYILIGADGRRDYVAVTSGGVSGFVKQLPELLVDPGIASIQIIPRTWLRTAYVVQPKYQAVGEIPGLIEGVN